MSNSTYRIQLNVTNNFVPILLGQNQCNNSSHPILPAVSEAMILSNYYNGNVSGGRGSGLSSSALISYLLFIFSYKLTPSVVQRKNPLVCQL